MKKMVYAGIGVLVLGIGVAAVACACTKNGGNETTTATETTERTFENDAQTNSLYFAHDGKITQTMTDSFEKDYYDVSEFESFVKEKVIDYNRTTVKIAASSAKEGGESIPVSLEKVEKTDNGVMMQITYKDSEDFIRFNQVYQDLGEEASLTFCEACDHPAEAEDQATNFVKAEDGSTIDALSVYSAVMDTDKQRMCVIINYGTEISTEGELVYLSENVTKVDDNTVTTVDGERSVIVFR